MDAKGLAVYAKERELWLIQRTLKYAKDNDYAKFTSTLEEAWRVSIAGLTESFTKLAAGYKNPAELSPNEDYTIDPAASFGIMEAQLHRSRGLTVSMFLGLMKYYRQAYVDLAMESSFTDEEKVFYRACLERFFDRVELGFVSEWTELTQDKAATELQELNRIMTNEKNRYLTVFESLVSPVILLNQDFSVRNMNHAAARLFHGGESPGKMYYHNGKHSGERLEWIDGELKEFKKSGEREREFEKDFATPVGLLTFQVKMSGMLDVSEKFTGVIVILNDVTDRVRYEKKLSFDAERDHLTGLFNRRVLEDSIKRAVARAKKSQASSLLYMDVDNLKAVNDNCGHADGDRLLEAVADVLRKHTRTEDVVARLGGDEFAVLMNHTEAAEAVKIAERIRASMPDFFDLCDDFNVGVSIGIVPIDGSEDYLAIISRGDMTMYKAKKAGRNRVILG